MPTKLTAFGTMLTLISFLVSLVYNCRIAGLFRLVVGPAVNTNVNANVRNDQCVMQDSTVR